MPEPLTDEQFQDLLRETDTFKLGIRGFSSIEDDIDAAILEAFVGDLPGGGVRQLGGFRTRLTLAVALGIVPPEFRRMIEELSRFRNDLAHGRASELTIQRARSLANHLQEALPDDLGPAFSPLEEGSPRATLIVTLIFARSGVRSGAEYARRRREEIQRDRLWMEAVRDRIQALQAHPPGQE